MSRSIPPPQSGAQKLGLFGGTFDPVHMGHLLVAQAAMEELELGRLFFVPAARSPFKPGSEPAPEAARVRLLRLALAGQDWCEVDPQELARGGVSYSIDTVLAYRQRFPGAVLFYLIGADHLSALPKWRRAAELAAEVEFVVIPRPGEGVTKVPDGFTVRWLRGFPAAISSSEIRARAQRGRSIRHLVPPAVEEEIMNNRLYFSD